jgi:GntR family transcriptional repressor for pyruvate dehydrogenase complex
MNGTPLFSPLKTKRAFEEIADQIRQLIYSGFFKPGDRLPPERELASQFKSGRMVVREAFCFR